MAEQVKTEQKPKRKPESGLGKLRFKLSKTKLRVPLMWFRHRSLRPQDLVFGTYPRSGTTWASFTMFEIFTGESANFNSVHSALKGVNKIDEAKQILPNGGRVIGSHESYRKEYTRGVYIVRDPRDVLLSEFAFMSALNRFDGSLDDFIKSFFRGTVHGFGAWPKHVASWLDSPIAGTTNLLVLRYEDLRRDPENQFRRIAEFAGVKRDAEAIRRAVANNSVDKMREKELAAPRKASVNGRFIRQGKVQGWKGQLSTEQLQLIESKTEHLLVRLGYPVGTASVSSSSAQRASEPLLATDSAGRD
jgi:hypothetical protein